jgi:hypothetical protein
LIGAGKTVFLELVLFAAMVLVVHVLSLAVADEIEYPTLKWGPSRLARAAVRQKSSR